MKGPTMTRQYLRQHFEENMLDGDAIQDGQMLSSQSVFEYIEEVVAYYYAQGVADALHDPNTHSATETSARNTRLTNINRKAPNENLPN